MSFKALSRMRVLFMTLIMFTSGPLAMALPDDELFEALRTAPTSKHADPLADDILMALTESGSPTADLVFERAILAEQAGANDVARELFDRVVIVKPDFSEAWFRRAMLFISDDLYDQAIQDLNESLTHEPRNFRAWMALGRVFSVLGRDKEALESYREAAAIHPYYEPALSEIRRLAPIVDGRAI